MNASEKKPYYKTRLFWVDLFITVLLAAAIGLQTGTLARDFSLRKHLATQICDNGGRIVNAIMYEGGTETVLTPETRNDFFVFRCGKFESNIDPNKSHAFIELEVADPRNDRLYRVWVEVPQSVIYNVERYDILRWDHEVGEWQRIKNLV